MRGKRSVRMMKRRKQALDEMSNHDDTTHPTHPWCTAKPAQHLIVAGGTIELDVVYRYQSN